MKRLFTQIKPDLGSDEQSADSNNHIVGSWKLSRIVDLQNSEVKPHWKEVWSFAAMDEAETNGVYVCNYINLHSIVGKWGLDGDCLRLIRKESEIVFSIVELTEKRLTINSIDKNSFYSKLEFQRVQ